MPRLKTEMHGQTSRWTTREAAKEASRVQRRRADREAAEADVLETDDEQERLVPRKESE
jgi:hypothetical protein